MYKYIALDCASILFANAYKLKQLKADEVETGAIYGFFRNILFLSQHFHCNKFLFCWDSKKSDRKKIYPDYKKKRKEKRKADPEMDKLYQALFTQVDKLKYEILPQCGFVNSFEQDGKEADDLLANLVLGYTRILMVSNDEDMFQMLDMCDIWSGSKQKLWSEQSFKKEYGIPAIDWVNVKAIAGCTSDEVKGVKGVGEKTAIKYINGELNIKTKAHQSIINNHDIYERNLELVELPIKGTEDLYIENDKLDLDEFIKMCKKYWFNSFLDQYSNDWESFFGGRV